MSVTDECDNEQVTVLGSFGKYLIFFFYQNTPVYTHKWTESALLQHFYNWVAKMIKDM